jgi:signal peptidase I
MIPNLLVGDHLLVNKVIYSPSLGGYEDAMLGKKPIRRGHVVIFKYPDEPNKDYVKRVIGLPGETVEIRDKTVLIDGNPLAEGYTRFEEPPLRREDPEYGFRSEDQRDNYGPETVPPGQLFVMGDNRDNSRDSRYWGFLPEDQVKGRAVIVYWSYDADRAEFAPSRGVGDWIKDTLTAFGKTRWRRFFHLIR